MGRTSREGTSGEAQRSRAIHPGDKCQLMAVRKCIHAAQDCLKLLAR